MLLDTIIEAEARAVCSDYDKSLPSDRKLLQHMLATVGSQPYAREQARNGGNRDAQFQSGSHLGELNLQLLPSELRQPSSDEIMARLRDAVGTIPDSVELTYTTSFFSTGAPPAPGGPQQHACMTISLFLPSIHVRAAAGKKSQARRRYSHTGCFR